MPLVGGIGAWLDRQLLPDKLLFIDKSESFMYQFYLTVLLTLLETSLTIRGA